MKIAPARLQRRFDVIQFSFIQMHKLSYIKAYKSLGPTAKALNALSKDCLELMNDVLVSNIAYNTSISKSNVIHCHCRPVPTIIENRKRIL